MDEKLIDVCDECVAAAGSIWLVQVTMVLMKMVAILITSFGFDHANTSFGGGYTIGHKWTTTSGLGSTSSGIGQLGGRWCRRTMGRRGLLQSRWWRTVDWTTQIAAHRNHLGNRFHYTGICRNCTPTSSATYLQGRKRQRMIQRII